MAAQDDPYLQRLKRVANEVRSRTTNYDSQLDSVVKILRAIRDLPDAERIRVDAYVREVQSNPAILNDFVGVALDNRPVAGGVRPARRAGIRGLPYAGDRDRQVAVRADLEAAAAGGQGAGGVRAGDRYRQGAARDAVLRPGPNRLQAAADGGQRVREALADVFHLNGSPLRDEFFDDFVLLFDISDDDARFLVNQLIRELKNQNIERAISSLIGLTELEELEDDFNND